MKDNSFKKLSVIIPCFRQEKTLKNNLKNVLTVLEGLHFDYEVVVVVDGRVDGTYEAAAPFKSSRVKVTGYQHNHGKGYALRYGMARSHGDLVAFIDGGSDLSPAGLQMLVSQFLWNKADIVIGSKWHPLSKVNYPWWRIIVSKTYGFLVKILFNLTVTDTQLGMKLFRREVLERVLPRLLVKKFAFDIEILAVSQSLGFTRIYEAPVELDWKKIESHVAKNLFRTSWEMFWDTLAVFYRLRILKYYDDNNKRRWRYDKDLQFKVNIG